MQSWVKPGIAASGPTDLVQLITADPWKKPGGKQAGGFDSQTDGKWEAPAPGSS